MDFQKEEAVMKDFLGERKVRQKGARRANGISVEK